MPLSLEEETKLLPLVVKVSDLIVNLMLEENSESSEEFHKIIKQISDISPIISTVYLNLYDRIPKIKSRLLDYVKNNF